MENYSSATGPIFKEKVEKAILEEVEAVCTRAIIIAEGKLLVDDTPENLIAQGDGRLDVFFRQVTTGQWQPAEVSA